MPSSPFYIDKVYDYVSQEMDDLQNELDDYRTLFESKINALATASLPTLPPLPVLTDPGTAMPELGSLTPAPVAPTVDIPAMSIPAQPPDTLGDLTDEIDAILASLPEFVPSITSLAIPDAPPPLDTSGMPVAPDLDFSVSVPTAPELAIPSMGALMPITIPEFVFPTLPTFDAVEPTLTATAPSSVAEWAEPEYTSELLDEIESKVHSMLAGSSGLPAAVELALFERTRAKDSVAATKAAQEIYDSFAARGFSMPPGMLAAAVMSIVEDSQLKANATAREVYIQAQQTLIQQLNVAIERGLSLEQLNMNLFTNALNRKFEITKLRVDQAIAIYNAEVQAFNIRSQAYNVSSQVFKVKIDAALTKLEEFRARIEAQKAIGQLNQQTVEVFTAQLGAVRSRVELYQAQLQGARTQTEVLQSQVQAYRTQIEAYATRLQAERTRFEVFKTQIDGEQAKAGILETEARVFASRIQAVSTAAQTSISKVNAKIEAARLSTQRFGALVTAERERVQAQAEQFRAVASVFSAQVGAYSAENSAKTELARLEVTKVEASLRNTIARYDAEIRKYDSESQRIIQLAALNIESLRAMAQYAAQLAAGAMSAKHLGMSVAGAGSGSDSYSYSESHNYQH